MLFCKVLKEDRFDTGKLSLKIIFKRTENSSGTEEVLRRLKAYVKDKVVFGPKALTSTKYVIWSR